MNRMDGWKFEENAFIECFNIWFQILAGCVRPFYVYLQPIVAMILTEEMYLQKYRWKVFHKKYFCTKHDLRKGAEWRFDNKLLSEVLIWYLFHFALGVSFRAYEYAHMAVVTATWHWRCHVTICHIWTVTTTIVHLEIYSKWDTWTAKNNVLCHFHPKRSECFRK